MEPDSASLHELGVRNGDTLVVGYKLAIPEVLTSMAESEATAGDDTLVAEVMEKQKDHPPGDVHLVLGSDRHSDDGVLAESATAVAETAEAAAGGDESNADNARGDTTAVAIPPGARARNDEIDDTEGGGGGGGGAEDNALILPSGSASGQGNGKAGRRRAWWSREKSRSMSRYGDPGEHGHDGSGNERSVEVVVPTSASSSATISSDSISGVNTRRVRVAPSPELPANLNAPTGGIVRRVEAASTGAVYVSATAGAAVRQPLTPSAGRTNLSGWARLGRRIPAFPIFSSEGGSGGGG